MVTHFVEHELYTIYLLIPVSPRLGCTVVLAALQEPCALNTALRLCDHNIILELTWSSESQSPSPSLHRSLDSLPQQLRGEHHVKFGVRSQLYIRPMITVHLSPPLQCILRVSAALVVIITETGAWPSEGSSRKLS